MYQYYNIIITGGTSPGPYTIYYDIVDPNNIALTYLDYFPATDLTLSQMVNGVSVTVPDGTYNIIVYNQLCGTNQMIPVQDTQKTYNFCLQIDADTLVHFNSNGLYEGYQSWISDDTTYFAYFNTSVNKWYISGGTLSYTILNASSYPPLSGWYTVGGGLGNLISYSGNCSTTTPAEILSLITSVNRPSCECDGSITVLPSGGIPPYSFSIDNGVTWNQNKTLFNNLCEGSYTVIVMDSTGETYGVGVILTSIEQPVTYTVTLNTTESIVTNTQTQLTKQYTTTVNVTPTLPQGVSLTLNLSHINNFSASTSPVSAQITTNTILNKNGSPQTLTNSTGSGSTSPNPIPGCQNQTMYITSFTENWNNITITSSDTLVFNTTTAIQKAIQDCLIGQATEQYLVDSATLSGCNCCSVIIGVNKI